LSTSPLPLAVVAAPGQVLDPLADADHQPTGGAFDQRGEQA